jgi:hypothetical protein
LQGVKVGADDDPLKDILFGALGNGEKFVLSVFGTPFSHAFLPVLIFDFFIIIFRHILAWHLCFVNNHCFSCEARRVGYLFFG